MQLFTDYYFASAPPLSPIALECLVRCASVRRSLFGSEETRVAFLAALMNVTLRVLQTRHGLEHQENYHEFCRCGRVSCISCMHGDTCRCGRLCCGGPLSHRRGVVVSVGVCGCAREGLCCRLLRNAMCRGGRGAWTASV